MKPILLLLVLIVFVIGCDAEIADIPKIPETNQEPEVKTVYIEEEKPVEKQKEVKNKSEENTITKTPIYYFELNNNQLNKDTIITIKFDDDNKLNTGILYINSNKIKIGQTNPIFSLYISRWVEAGGNYYQIKEYNSSSSKIEEINVKNGGNYVSLKYPSKLK